MSSAPTEIWARVFECLPYTTLLTVSCVCDLWRHIVQDDPRLQVKLYKRESMDRTLDETKRSPSLSVEFHPAINKVSYYMGNAIDDAAFRSRKGDATLPLALSAVAKDFATIPAVTHMEIEVPSATASRPRFSTILIMVKVENPMGVRVIDIFQEISRETRVLSDLLFAVSGAAFHQRLYLGQRPAMGMKADLLGRHRYFAGFGEGRRKGADVFVQALTRETYTVKFPM